MTTIGERISEGIVVAIASPPLGAMGGYLFGYLYAKCTDLPRHQVAKYYAIWAAASGAINILITTLTESAKIRAILNVISAIGNAAVAVNLHKAGLMGHKLVSIIVSIQVIAVIGYLASLT